MYSHLVAINRMASPIDNWCFKLNENLKFNSRTLTCCKNQEEEKLKDNKRSQSVFAPDSTSNNASPNFGIEIFQNMKLNSKENTCKEMKMKSSEANI